MVFVLYLFGALTIIIGVGLGIYLAELGSEVVATYILGGLVSSVVWFALAMILSRQNAILELLRANRAVVAAGALSAPSGSPLRGPVRDSVVVVSSTRYGSPGDLVQARLVERALALEGYEDLPSAFESEWEHFTSVVPPGESLHASVEEAEEFAKAIGFKAFAYRVTRKEFHRQLGDVLPSVRG